MMASLLALAIADVPDLASALLRDHERAPDGRCAACSGSQRGRVRHPCTIYGVATAARAVIAERRRAS